MKITALDKNNTSRIITANTQNKQLNFGMTFTKFKLEINKPPNEATRLAVGIGDIIKKHDLGYVLVRSNPLQSTVEMNVDGSHLEAIIDLLEKIANENRIHLGVVLDKETICKLL